MNNLMNKHVNNSEVSIVFRIAFPCYLSKLKIAAYTELIILKKNVPKQTVLVIVLVMHVCFMHCESRYIFHFVYKPVTIDFNCPMKKEWPERGKEKEYATVSWSLLIVRNSDGVLPLLNKPDMCQ